MTNYDWHCLGYSQYQVLFLFTCDTVSHGNYITSVPLSCLKYISLSLSLINKSHAKLAGVHTIQCILQNMGLLKNT